MVTMISTRTLVINPAFLQEIKDCNPDLWRSIADLRKICDDSESKQLSEVANDLMRCLDLVREQLSLQFALEEAYGFIEVPAKSDESASSLAFKARDQHCLLYLEVSELAEIAEELQYRGVEPNGLENLLMATKRFDQQLQDHEQLEADMIAGVQQ